MKRWICRILSLGLVASMLPACGGSVKEAATSASAPVFPIQLDGSTALGPSAKAGNGGAFFVLAEQNLSMGDGQVPSAPLLNAPPTFGTTVTSTSLAGAAFTLSDGDILVPGSVTAPAAQPTFTLTSTLGNIVISGSLLAGVVGASNNTSNLVLDAPNGTVYITGLVSTTSPAGSGAPASGSVTINARSIVVTGSIVTLGVALPGGAPGGSVTLNANVTGDDDIILVGATVNTTGSSGTVGAGAGGNIAMNALNAVRIHDSFITAAAGSTSSGTAGATAPVAGNVTLNGVAETIVGNTSFDLSGGSCSSATGGTTASAGGAFLVPTTVTGIVSFFGSVRATGGVATGVSGAITSGDGGSFTIGAGVTGPQVLTMGTVALTVTGGTAASAGNGGAVTLNNMGSGDTIVIGSIDSSAGDATDPAGTNGANGNIWSFGGTGRTVVQGTFTSRGGNSSNPVSPATQGGPISFMAKNGTTGGDVIVNATIDNSGGSSTAPLTTSVSGGAGGTIQFGTFPTTTGTMLIQGTFTSTGGNSTGTATAGTGGGLHAGSWRQPWFVSGTYVFRGGTALGTGGTGGAGGATDILADAGTPGIGGDILFMAGSTMDASGGTGTVGGAGGSITFQSDTSFSQTLTNGRIINNGTLTARGGVANGAGGIIHFRGRADGTVYAIPVPGTVDASPDGTGAAGVITMD